MLETSCTNRYLHNKHDNVICANKSFIEKDYKQFLVKNESVVITKNQILTFFPNFFHVYFVKVLDITSIDQDKNMHSFYKKQFQS